MRTRCGQSMWAGIVAVAMVTAAAQAKEPVIVVTPIAPTSTAAEHPSAKVGAASPSAGGVGAAATGGTVANGSTATSPSANVGGAAQNQTAANGQSANVPVGVGVLVNGAAATSQPADGEMWAEFVGVTGTVQFRANAASAWQQAKVGDRITAPAEVRTHARNSVALLRLGNSAVVQIPSSTRVALAELATHTETNTEKVYIFLNRGTVRADIYEQNTRSDFKIGCPKAVLSREGTKGIEFSYDPASGDYRVALNTNGMIRLIDRGTGRQTEVLPGQYVTQDFVQWIQTARLDRLITLIDPNGTTHVEQLLSAANAGGLAGIDPTNIGTWQSILLTQETVQTASLQGLSAANQQQLQMWQDVFNPKPTQRRPYQYGNFGTHIPDSNGVSGTTVKRSQFSRHHSYRQRPGT